MTKLPTLIGIAKAFVRNDWLKTFNHERSSAIPSAFITVQKIRYTKPSIQAISVDTMLRIAMLIALPKLRKGLLPTSRIRNVMTCQQHLRRLLEKSLYPGLHAEEWPPNFLGSILWFSEGYLYETTINVDWVQDVV